MKYIDLYEGGRAGIQARFAERIQCGLQNISFRDAADVLKTAGLQVDVLLRIVDRKDTGGVNHALVDALADPLHLDIQEVFGPPKKIEEDPELRKSVGAEADAKRFMVVGGATRPAMTLDERINLFALLQAFQEL